MKKSTLIKLSLLFFGLIFTSCVKDVKSPKEPLSLDPYHISVERAIATMNATIAELYSGTRTPRDYTIETLKGKDIQNPATRSDTLPPLPEEVFYIVNFANDEGFAVLAADTRLDPVLAITEKGSLSVIDFELREPADTLTPLMPNEIISELMSQYIERKLEENTTDLPAIGGEEGVDLPIGVTPPNFVEPLLTTRWNQAFPYNAMAPKKSGVGFGYEGRAPAGCVAVAIAQIVAYHEKPLLSNQMKWHPAPTSLSNNGFYIERFNTTWSELKNYPFNNYWNSYSYIPNSQDTIMYSNIALLLYDIGGGVYMDYSADGSGALDTDARNYLRNELEYDVYMHWSYNEGAILKELNAGRPVYIRTNAPMEWWFIIPIGCDGHAWVIDGYKYVYQKQTSNGNIVFGKYLMVHCNMGWAGDCDGYYLSKTFNTSNPNNDYDSSNNEDFNYVWNYSTIEVKP